MRNLNPNTVMSVVTLIVGLLITNGLVTNSDGKLITGAATGLVSAAFLIYDGIKAHARAKVIIASGGGNTVAANLKAARL